MRRAPAAGRSTAARACASRGAACTTQSTASPATGGCACARALVLHACAHAGLKARATAQAAPAPASQGQPPSPLASALQPPKQAPALIPRPHEQVPAKDAGGPRDLLAHRVRGRPPPAHHLLVRTASSFYVWPLSRTLQAALTSRALRAEARFNLIGHPICNKLPAHDPECPAPSAAQQQMPAQPARRGLGGCRLQRRVGVPHVQGDVRRGLRVVLQLRALPQEGAWLRGALLRGLASSCRQGAPPPCCSCGSSKAGSARLASPICLRPGSPHALRLLGQQPRRRTSTIPGPLLTLPPPPCLQLGLEPTHQIARLARADGFSNVHDYLVHLVTGAYVYVVCVCVVLNGRRVRMSGATEVLLGLRASSCACAP